MAFYTFEGNNKAGYPFGRILREGLDGFRESVEKLQHVKGILQQMTDAQIQAAFNFATIEDAQAAKAELLSDIPALSPATQQMLDQFG